MFSFSLQPLKPAFLLFISFCGLQAYAQIDSSQVNRSPYGVIYNHLYYLQADSYSPEKAARSFNLPQEEAEKAAIRLKQVLDGRGFFVDIHRLPQEFNYMDSVSEEPVYIIDKNEPLIYVEKVDSAWFYSRTTVDNLKALHDEVYPLGSLGTYFESPAWQYKILDIKLWQWLGVVALLLLGYVFFWLISKVSNPIVKRIAGVKMARLEELRQPFRRLSRLIGLALAVQFVSYFLPMLQIAPRINSIFIKGLHILFLFFLIFIVNKIVEVLFFYFRTITAKTENTLDDQLLPVLHKIATGVVWALGLIYILDYLDVNITALLAGISIGGLALALAAQDTVKNFFGSIMIFVDKPFQIGDWIRFGDTDGVVEEVGIRSTRIRTFANSITYVPNGMLANQVVDNYGLRQFRRFNTEIGITYDTPPGLIDVFVDGIREIILMHPTARKDFFEVHLNKFDASSLTIMVYMFFEAATWTDELKGRHQVMNAIIKLADKLGVRFAFPTQTLHIEELPGAGNTTPEPKNPSDAERLKKESLEEIKGYFG